MNLRRILKLLSVVVVLCGPLVPAFAGDADEIVAMINAERAAKGLPGLAVNAQLEKSAQKHATDMHKKSYFSHTGKNGSTLMQRVKRAGYKPCLAAENLSIGYSSVAKAIEGWMNSKGHRQNILRKGVTEIGIGVADGALYVAVFAKPCR